MGQDAALTDRWKLVRCRLVAACLLADESGQDLIEYALVAALIGLASVASLRGLSNKIASSFGAIANGLSSAY